MAKSRPYKRPTRRLRRSKGEKRSFAERLRERQQAKAQPSQAVEFNAFLRTVLGKPPSKAEVDAARKKIKGLAADLGRPNTSTKIIREIYDQIAGHYPKLIMPGRFGQEIKIITGHANMRPTDCIASICSGPGILEAFFAKKIVPQGKVTCVDISPEMNRVAERVKAKAGVENMDILTRPGNATGLPTSSQDKVIVMQTDLPKTIHWQPLLDEVKRIIKKGPDARFVVSFATTNRADAKEVIQSLEKNRFKTTAIKYAESGKREAIMAIARYTPI